MIFQKFDAGANHRGKNGDIGDCQVRALSTACGIPYWDAWRLLYTIQGEKHMCGLPLVEALREQDHRLGVLRQLDFPAVKGHNRMNGVNFCKTHRVGRYILRMAHHVVAVRDGVLIDKSDTSLSCVYTAWEMGSTR